MDLIVDLNRTTVGITTNVATRGRDHFRAYPAFQGAPIDENLVGCHGVFGKLRGRETPLFKHDVDAVRHEHLLEVLDCGGNFCFGL